MIRGRGLKFSSTRFLSEWKSVNFRHESLESVVKVAQLWSSLVKSSVKVKWLAKFAFQELKQMPFLFFVYIILFSFIKKPNLHKFSFNWVFNSHSQFFSWSKKKYFILYKSEPLNMPIVHRAKRWWKEYILNHWNISKYIVLT